METTEPSSTSWYRSSKCLGSAHRSGKYYAAGYRDERMRKIFLNSDIDHRHFHLEGQRNNGAVKPCSRTKNAIVKGAVPP
jgi:hypothetical protein